MTNTQLQKEMETLKSELRTVRNRFSDELATVKNELNITKDMVQKDITRILERIEDKQTLMATSETQNQKEEVKLSYGQPWEIAAKFDNYIHADSRRRQISEVDNHVDVKVQKMAGCFVVKTRLKEEYFVERAPKTNKKKRNGKKKL